MKNRIFHALIFLLTGLISFPPPSSGEESLQSLYLRVSGRSGVLRLVSDEESAHRDGRALVQLFLPVISFRPAERHSIAPAGPDFHGSELLYSLEQPLFPGPSIAALRSSKRSGELLLRLKREEAEDALLMELLVLIGSIETLAYRKTYAHRLQNEAHLLRKAAEASFELGEISSGSLRSAVLTERRRDLDSDFLEAEEEIFRLAWQRLTGDSALPSIGRRKGGDSEISLEGVGESIFSRDPQVLIISQGIEELERRKAFGFESWIPELTLNLHGTMRTGAGERNEFGWTLVISFRGPGFDLSGSLDYTLSRDLRHAQEGLFTLRTGEIIPKRKADGERSLEIRREELRGETDAALLDLRKAEKEIPLLREELKLSEELYRRSILEMAGGLISAGELEKSAAYLSASAEALAQGVYRRYLKQAALLLKAGRRRELLLRGLPDPGGGCGEGVTDR
jgi:hypothetical protein